MQSPQKSFSFRAVVIGGFFLFFSMLFSLATAVYKDYRLQSQIQRFQEEVEGLASAARSKPDDIAYFQSEQYKDRYGKESLNLLNAGEKMIIIPAPSGVVERGEAELMTEALSPSSVLYRPHREQWKEYFFGKTLSLGL